MSPGSIAGETHTRIPLGGDVGGGARGVSCGVCQANLTPPETEVDVTCCWIYNLGCCTRKGGWGYEGGDANRMMLGLYVRGMGVIRNLGLGIPLKKL